MAGAAAHIAYVSDDGTTYRALVPAWQQALTGDALLATGPGLPKGYRRRHRMLQDQTTGRQIKVTVGTIGSTSWTAAFGATPATQPSVPGHAGATYHYAGRIGERDLIRG